MDQMAEVFNSDTDTKLESEGNEDTLTESEGYSEGIEYEEEPEDEEVSSEDEEVSSEDEDKQEDLKLLKQEIYRSRQLLNEKERELAEIRKQKETQQNNTVDPLVERVTQEVYNPELTRLYNLEIESLKDFYGDDLTERQKQIAYERANSVASQAARIAHANMQIQQMQEANARSLSEQEWSSKPMASETDNIISYVSTNNSMLSDKVKDPAIKNILREFVYTSQLLSVAPASEKVESRVVSQNNPKKNVNYTNPKGSVGAKNQAQIPSSVMSIARRMGVSEKQLRENHYGG